MEKEEIKRMLYITMVFTILGISGLYFYGINVFTKEGVFKISSVISGIAIFWTFYFAYLWKFPILNNLIYRNNLNGTWLGEYYSKDLTSGQEYRGEIALVIRQSFLNINITSYTERYLSFSFAESFIVNNERKKHQLVYLYSQNEFDITDDNARKGATELLAICESESMKLFGHFWTNKNSKGKLDIKRVSKKHYNSFNDAKNWIKDI